MLQLILKKINCLLLLVASTFVGLKIQNHTSCCLTYAATVPGSVYGSATSAGGPHSRLRPQGIQCVHRGPGATPPSSSPPPHAASSWTTAGSLPWTSTPGTERRRRRAADRPRDRSRPSTRPDSRDPKDPTTSRPSPSSPWRVKGSGPPPTDGESSPFVVYLKTNTVGILSQISISMGQDTIY
jgi:hypothetical protein